MPRNSPLVCLWAWLANEGNACATVDSIQPGDHILRMEGAQPCEAVDEKPQRDAAAQRGTLIGLGFGNHWAVRR